MAAFHISLAAEKIAAIGPLPVTNSLLTTWIVMALLSALAYLTTRNISMVPGYAQSLAEIVVGGLYNLFESILHDKVKKLFPLLATLFLFIISLNWAGLFPGVGTVVIEKVEVGVREVTPILRSGTADLNTTLALALVAMISIQIAGLSALKGAYLKKFFNFGSPIAFYVGILELISEFSKVISFAFRLFGNIFAGEVLLTVIATLMPVVGALPFFGLELFVGFIQALVFSMLTAVFLSVAVIGEH